MSAPNGDIVRAVVLFSKDLVDKYQLGNLYDMVRNRTWTYDTFESLLTKITSQSSDILPVVRGGFNVWGNALVYSNGGVFTEDTHNGYKFVADTNQKTLNALQYIQKLMNSNYLYDNTAAFTDGGAVFYLAIYNELRKFTNQTLVNDLNVGLLPYPLGPDAVAEGLPYGTVTHHVETFYIMENIKKPEEAAAIVVAMANRLSREGLLQHELKYNLQDTDSAEMLDMMTTNLKVNPTEILGGLSTVLTSILSNQMTPIQAMQTVASSVQENYDKNTNIEVLALGQTPAPTPAPMPTPPVAADKLVTNLSVPYGSVVVDGNYTDAKWSKGVLLDYNNETATQWRTDTPTPLDFTGKIYTLWDNNGLYIGGEFLDPVV